jgi:hypothetical protein
MLLRPPDPQSHSHGESRTGDAGNEVEGTFVGEAADASHRGPCGVSELIPGTAKRILSSLGALLENFSRPLSDRLRALRLANCGGSRA